MECSVALINRWRFLRRRACVEHDAPPPSGTRTSPVQPTESGLKTEHFLNLRVSTQGWAGLAVSQPRQRRVKEMKTSWAWQESTSHTAQFQDPKGTLGMKLPTNRQRKRHPGLTLGFRCCPFLTKSASRVTLPGLFNLGCGGNKVLQGCWEGQGFLNAAQTF